jgi:hypothetical protein
LTTWPERASTEDAVILDAAAFCFQLHQLSLSYTNK